MAIYHPWGSLTGHDDVLAALDQWRELSPVPAHLLRLARENRRGANVDDVVRKASDILKRYLPIEVYCGHVFEEGFSESNQVLGVFLAREQGTNRPVLSTENDLELRFDATSGLFVPAVKPPLFHSLIYGNSLSAPLDERRFPRAIRTRYDLAASPYSRSVS